MDNTPLAVTGRLSIELAPAPNVQLAFAGDHMVIDLARLPSREELAPWAAALRGGTAQALQPQQPQQSPQPGTAAPGRDQRREIIDGIDQGLRRLNLDVEFRIGGAIVARMGPHAQPSLSARLLGLGPVEFHALALLGKWLGM